MPTSEKAVQKPDLLSRCKDQLLMLDFSIVAGNGDFQVMVVYAPTQNAFYRSFAQRLFLACREVGPSVKLVSSDSISGLSADEIKNSSALLVNPRDLLFRLADRELFLKALSGFRRRIMVLAEAVETKWFSHQLTLPISFDGFVDVGFVPQARKLERLGLSRLPYRFMFNGLLPRELDRLRSQSAADSSMRSIPWALIGHKTVERVEFARWLAETISPRGVLFLPDQGHGVRPGSGAISPQGVDLLLKKVRYYVWTTHHDHAYYESFRYREAVINGAVPIKLDERFFSDHSSVPGVVANRDELARALAVENYERAYEMSRSFYLEHRSLPEEVTEVVLDEL